MAHPCLSCFQAELNNVLNILHTAMLKKKKKISLFLFISFSCPCDCCPELYLKSKNSDLTYKYSLN